MVRKEWKLIRRDPYLISQVLLQTIYFLPAVYLFLFTDTGPSGRLSFAPTVAAVLTVLAGTSSSSLARIAVVGEEATDLLAASPLGRRRIERAKMLAVLVPVWALLLPPVVWLLATELAAGLAALALAPAASYAVTQMRIWNPATAGRKDLFKSKGMGDPVVAALEFVVPVSMAVATFLLATASWWLLLPFTVALTCLLVAYVRRS